MSVKIGHASIDERGKATGGAAGDQTGKEVCIRDWYDKGWDLVLRPKTKIVAEKIAATCEAACANDNIGYDQSGRLTLYDQAKKVKHDLGKIKTPCECDCSSLMAECAIAAGIDISPALTTSNMARAFVLTGQFDILTDSKYIDSPDYLLRGDILVKEGHHTACVLTDAVKASNPYSEPTLTLYKGCKSNAVKWVQYELVQAGYGLAIDGSFGPATDKAVREYQRSRGRGLVVDGRVGPATRKALKAD